MKSSSWILVHEYITGGGWDSGAPPDGLAAEAATMLRAVLLDYAAWGQVPILTLLDRRLAHLDLPADEVIPVDPGQYATRLQTALARCDAALIIGPETNGILAELSQRALAAGVQLIGASPDAVRLAGDKWACYRQWLAAGVPTPLTRRTTFAEAATVAREMGYPLVVKPIDGMDCTGVSLVSSADELPLALDLACRNVLDYPILLQPYLRGKHASVSLLVSRGRVQPLSLNSQAIQPGRPFSYRGGTLPLSHPAGAAALAVAQHAAEAIPGLEGYAGVDLVLDRDRAWAIEINPRLTTSYIGLRQVVDINLAQAIWAACVDGILPAAVKLHGRASFSKDRPGGLWGIV
jgi:tyramine---L-glutamate ligase